MARRLQIEGFKYEPSSGGFLKQGVRGHKVPINAVRGGNGSFIVAESPKVLVNVHDVDTDDRQTVNMYISFKSMIYPMRMTEKRARMMIDYYRQQGVFEAQDWDMWPQIPEIYAVIS